MQVNFSIEEGVVLIDYRDAVIDSDTRFDEWATKLHEGFQHMLEHFGEKYPLAVCIDGLQLDRTLGERYSRELAVLVAERFASGIVRYGKKGRTKSVIAIESMRRLEEEMPGADNEAYSANLFESKQEAMHFLRFLQNR